jgi:hypothetical protein
MAYQSEIKSRSYKEEVMVFWFCPKIFEYRLLPIPFHIIPIFNHALPDGIIDTISRGLGVREGLIANEEVKIFDAAFGSQMSGFGGNRWACAA